MRLVILLGTALLLCLSPLASAGGGPGDECIPAAQRARVERDVARYHARFGSHWPTGLRPLDVGPAPYPFHPHAGSIWQDLFLVNFVDLDPTTGLLDWDCTQFTYDGHNGIDSMVRSFDEQDAGVPVFAALDGWVADAHDGEDDRNTSLANVPANYVILDHGGTHDSWYWHLRKNSVAVTVNQFVKAGTQLGLTASSGYSNWPHLHFESHYGGVRYEPYAGTCRPGPSNWVNQQPIRRDTCLGDFSMLATDLQGQPQPPNGLPRTGTFVMGTRDVSMWNVTFNLPASSNYRIRYLRPDGSVRVDFSGSLNNPFYRWSWWWWHPVSMNLDAPGTWTAELTLNGQRMIQAPFTVVSSASQVRNRPPNPVSAVFDPPQPRVDQVVFCRVQASLTLDDPDYDLVLFRYRWTSGGRLLRDVTTAALSDAIPHDLAAPGELLECEVTPTDRIDDGPPVTVQATVSGYPARGTVRENGAGLQGVTISSDAASTETASDGTYTLADLAPGSHTLRASKDGYTFAPASRNVTVPPDAAGIDFTGTRHFAIRGTVTMNGQGLANVRVGAGNRSALTGSDGGFALTELTAGSYTVHPLKDGYTFTPTELTVSAGPVDAEGLQFAAELVPKLVSLTLSPTSIRGGKSATGTVTFNRILAAALPVTLTTSNKIVTLPRTPVQVAGGQRSATFPIKTKAVKKTTPVTITASYGSVQQPATVNLTKK